MSSSNGNNSGLDIPNNKSFKVLYTNGSPMNDDNIVYDYMLCEYDSNDIIVCKPVCDVSVMSGWQQTQMPSAEELNLDVTIAKEKMQAEKLAMGKVFSKNRKNKSKLMVFSPRQTNSKHVPYWNVNRYLMHGACEYIHHECRYLMVDVLNDVAEYVRMNGRFPSVKRMSSMYDNRSAYIDGSDYWKCGMDEPVCQYGMMTELQEIKQHYCSVNENLDTGSGFYEVEEKFKLGNMRFDVFGPVPIRLNRVSYSLPDSVGFHDVFINYVFDFPECIRNLSVSNPHREFFHLYYEFITMSVMTGSFTEGLEKLRLNHACLSPLPARWISKEDVCGVNSGVLKYFPQFDYSLKSWYILFCVLHAGITDQYFGSFVSLFNACKMDVHYRDALRVVEEASKVGFMSQWRKLDRNDPLKALQGFELDGINDNYKILLKRKEIRPFYKLSRTILNVMVQSLKKLNFISGNVFNPYLTLDDLLRGAANLWKLKADNCVHGLIQVDSPCQLSSAHTAYTHSMCRNHGIFCHGGWSNCYSEINVCSVCKPYEMPLAEVLRLEEHGEEPLPTMDPCCSKNLEQSPTKSSWSWSSFWSSSSVDESYSYPEEGYTTKSDFKWMEQCFKAFYESFITFVRKEFGGFLDAMSGLFTGLWDMIKAPFMSVANCLSDIASPFISILESMIRILGLSRYVKGRNLTIDLYAILICLIIYKSVDNPIFKILVLVFILRRFNVIQNVQSFINFFRSHMFSYVVPELEESATPTSMFDFITVLSTSYGMELMVKVVMCSIFTVTGLAATAVHKATICRVIVEFAKNLHFVGAGMAGLVKIWGFISTGIPKLLKIIRELLGKENEDDKKVKENQANLTLFSNQLMRYFTFCSCLDNEQGYGLIRKSQELQEKVVSYFEFDLLAHKLKLDPMYKDIFTPALCVQLNNAHRSYAKLHDLVTRVTKFGQFRPTPFHVQFVGNPGVGKSTLLQSFSHEIKQRYFPDTPNNSLIFTRGKTDYFDGYCNQPIMIQDDIWSVNDYKEVAEILPLISNAPLVIPMAHLTDKATYFDSKFILTTTNTMFPQTSAVFCNEAIWRRRHILAEVTIDENVYDKSTSKFDMDLFSKFYPGQSISDLPHLKFSILQPVPDQSTQRSVLREALPYVEGSNLPKGLTLPLSDLTYAVFLEKVFKRYEALRKEEKASNTMDTSNLIKSVNEMKETLEQISSVNPHYLGRLARTIITTPDISSDEDEAVSAEVVAEVIEELEGMEAKDDSDSEAGEVDPFNSVPTSDFEEPLEFTEEYEKKLRSAVLTPLTHDNNSILIDLMLTTGCPSDFTLSNYSYVLQSDISESHYELITSMRSSYINFLNIQAKREKRGVGVFASSEAKYVENKEFDPSDESYMPLIGEQSMFDRVGMYSSLDPSHLVTNHAWQINNFRGASMTKIIVDKDKTCNAIRLDTRYPQTNRAFHVHPPGWNSRKPGVLDASFLHPGLVNPLLFYKSKQFKSCVEKYSYVDVDRDQKSKIISQLKHDFVSRLRKMDFVQHSVKGLLKWEEEGGSFKVGACASNLLQLERQGIPIPKDFDRWMKTDRLRYYLKFAVRRTAKTYWAFVDDPSMLARCSAVVKAMSEALSEMDKSRNYVSAINRDVYRQVPLDRKISIIELPYSFSEDFLYQMKLFLSLPDELRHALVDFCSRKSVAALAKLSCDIRSNFKYYATKFHYSVYNNIHLPLIGMADLLIAFVVGVYACIIYYALRQLFVSFFGVKEKGEQSEATSRVMFKRSLNPNLANKSIPVATNSTAIENVVNKIRRNQVQVRLDDVGCSNALGIDGQNLLINTHFIRSKVEAGSPFLLYFRPTSCNEDEWCCMIDPKKDIRVLPDTDASIIYNSNFRCFARIVHLFVTQDDLYKYEVPEYLYNVYLKENKEYFSSFVCRGVLDSYKVNFLDNEVRNVMAYNAPRVMGSSGGIVFASNNFTQRPIYGIQAFATSHISYAALLTQELLRRFMFDSIVHNGPFEASDVVTPTSELIDQHLNIVGSVNKRSVQGIVRKTSFEETIFSNVFPSTEIPAILNAFDYRVPDDTHPLQHSVNKFGRDIIKPMPIDVLDKAIVDVTAYIKGEIGNRKLCVLDDWNDCVNGLEAPGYGRLDLSTSPGIPWVYFTHKRGKKTWIERDAEGSIIYFDPALRLELEEVDRSIRRGEIPANSMFEFPKDELRPETKALGPPIKTRSISVMNFIYTILFRKYCLSLEAVLHTMADGVFPLCVGINPMSIAWTNIYVSLRNKNGVGNDFDIGNWDGHFPSWLFNAVCDCFNNLYADSKENGVARRSLFMNACFGYTQFLDCVLQKNRGMPSGFAGTASVNTFGHFILFYCFYIIICKELGLTLMFDDFRTNIAIFFYGDDVVFSISQNFKDLGIVPARFVQLYNDYGWPISSASKLSDPSIEKPIEDLQFLKRKFVCDPLLGNSLIYGAIDESVINNLLHWQRRTPNLNQQLYMNIYDALEFAYAHGEEYYTKILNRINDVLILNHRSPVVMSYHDCRAIMFNRYFNM